MKNLNDNDNKSLENLKNKLHYTYKKIPAAFLEIEFPKFPCPIYFEDIEYNYEEIYGKLQLLITN